MQFLKPTHIDDDVQLQNLFQITTCQSLLSKNCQVIKHLWLLLSINY